MKELAEKIIFADRIFVSVITSKIPSNNLSYSIKNGNNSISPNIYDFSKRWYNCTIIESYVDDDGGSVLWLEDDMLKQLDEFHKNIGLQG